LQYLFSFFLFFFFKKKKEEEEVEKRERCFAITNAKKERRNGKRECSQKKFFIAVQFATR
jgi:hypothetical protein